MSYDAGCHHGLRAGGTFANGAVTAAMAYAFNQLQEGATRREAARNLLLAEGESPDVLTNRLMRKRLGLLREEIGSLTADLANMSMQEFVEYTGRTYSPGYDDFHELARDTMVSNLRRTYIGLGARRLNAQLDALGNAVVEYGLTRGGGRVLRRMGASQAVSEISPIAPEPPMSRSAWRRTPHMHCSDVAICAVDWR